MYIFSPLELLLAVEPAIAISLDVLAIVTYKQLARTLARGPVAPVPVQYALKARAQLTICDRI